MYRIFPFRLLYWPAGNYFNGLRGLEFRQALDEVSDEKKRVVPKLCFLKKTAGVGKAAPAVGIYLNENAGTKWDLTVIRCLEFLTDNEVEL